MPESAKNRLTIVPDLKEEPHLRLVGNTDSKQLTGLNAVAAIAKGLNKSEVEGLSSGDPSTDGIKSKVADRR